MASTSNSGCSGSTRCSKAFAMSVLTCGRSQVHRTSLVTWAVAGLITNSLSHLARRHPPHRVAATDGPAVREFIRDVAQRTRLAADRASEFAAETVQCAGHFLVDATRVK